MKCLHSNGNKGQKEQTKTALLVHGRRIYGDWNIKRSSWDNEEERRLPKDGWNFDSSTLVVMPYKTSM